MFTKQFFPKQGVLHYKWQYYNLNYQHLNYVFNSTCSCLYSYMVSILEIRILDIL